jgi:glycosyltransferase involved in cell wall biosynthesis
VYHGLPPDLFDFAPRHLGYLAFVGRISPEKRPDRAIDVARRAGMTLRMAAKVDSVDHAYFERIIRPMMREPAVRFVGEIGDTAKNELLGGAAALLFPIDWPEPFGLVMIEAMACGTPVIAWRCGSVEEVVEHGRTGFIVDTEEEAIDAVHRIDTLDRGYVRAEFERRFSAAAMARAYVDVYKGRLGRRDASPAEPARSGAEVQRIPSPVP